jgi:hypothetical protein
MMAKDHQSIAQTFAGIANSSIGFGVTEPYKALR